MLKTTNSMGSQRRYDKYAVLLWQVAGMVEGQLLTAHTMDRRKAATALRGLRDRSSSAECLATREGRAKKCMVLCKHNSQARPAIGVLVYK